MKKFILISLLPFLGLICLHAQEERLTGLAQNARLIKESKKISLAKQGAIEAVKLPFTDDFSNYTGYPDPALWSDRQGFVNNSFPVFPPTVGVVTLDALNQFGKIYAHGNELGFAADSLTSHPIRLDSLFNPKKAITIQDSLYFSFYYQPGGGIGNPWETIGDPPENKDSLILEFGYATGDTIFIGYEYSEYVVDQDYIDGDIIPNPFIPGLDYQFTSTVFEGDVVYMPSDSIFSPEKIWNRIWATPGFSVNELYQRTGKYFEQILIPIKNEEYLKNSFQFRFRNYASLQSNNEPRWASNVDQWHIDYVRLDVNRTAQDTCPNDIAFAGPAVSLLKKYQAMPWSQYNATELKDTIHNQLINISKQIKNSNYTYNVVKNGSQLIKNYTTSNENIYPYYPYGLQNYQPHTDPPLSFSLPTDAADSALFTITHIFKEEGSGDARQQNDTTIFEQKFYNYYAYDDGTAENGYLLTSSGATADLAMRFTLNHPDSLRCIQMWFNHVFDENVQATFTLMVWGDNNNKPGAVLYSKQNQLPMYADEYLDFVNYYLDEPLYVSGTFYVGFRQFNNIQLNIGFDQNVDPAQHNIVNHKHFLYKTGTEWKESIINGTPMIRAVVGEYYDAISIEEYEPTSFSLYPNPASTEINVRFNDGQTLDNEDFEVSIYSVSGNLLLKTNTKTINTSSLSNGFYLMGLLNKKTNLTSYSKFVIQN